GQLARINDILEAGTQAYGAEFARVLNGALSPHRNQTVRYVRPLRVCPSRDLGTLAVEYAGSPDFRRRRNGLGLARRTILKVGEKGRVSGAGLAVYPVFGGGLGGVSHRPGRGVCAGSRGGMVSLLQQTTRLCRRSRPARHAGERVAQRSSSMNLRGSMLLSS